MGKIMKRRNRRRWMTLTQKKVGLRGDLLQVARLNIPLMFNECNAFTYRVQVLRPISRGAGQVMTRRDSILLAGRVLLYSTAAAGAWMIYGYWPR